MFAHESAINKAGTVVKGNSPDPRNSTESLCKNFLNDDIQYLSMWLSFSMHSLMEKHTKIYGFGSGSAEIRMKSFLFQKVRIRIMGCRNSDYRLQIDPKNVLQIQTENFNNIWVLFREIDASSRSLERQKGRIDQNKHFKF